MIGEKLNGTIIKKPTEPYIYITPEGEKVEMEFTYEYTCIHKSKPIPKSFKDI